MENEKSSHINNSQFSTLHSPSQNRATILLVDDNADIRRILRTALEMKGYGVEVCQSLPEAREYVRGSPPGLILLDAELPDGSGLDFCREYRARYGTGTPVVFLAGLYEKPDIVAGYDAGCTDYITKPCDIDILLLKTQALISNAQLRIENYGIASRYIQIRPRSGHIHSQFSILNKKKGYIIMRTHTKPSRVTAVLVALAIMLGMYREIALSQAATPRAF